jgi:lipoprotein-anchoring transpeptidase ErfK/SrfK
VGLSLGRARLRAPVGVVAGVLGLALVLSGCQGDDAAGDGGAVPDASQAATPAAEVAVTPSDQTAKVRLDKAVLVNVKQGTLDSVTVKAGKKTLKGALTDDKTAWKSTGVLAPGAKYSVLIRAADADGKVAETTSSFRTLAPRRTATTWIQPSDGATVGVGMPVILNFSQSVSEKNRAAVMKRLKVTSRPQVEGAWRWFSSQQVQWRPKEYWPTGTKVHVASNLAGVELGKGIWGATKPASVDFTVGSSMINTVDVTKHTLTVRKNGEVIKTIPVTTGKSGFATRNGVKVIMSRESERRMDAATTGTDPADPEYYDIKVKYAMRLTWSGEFLHAAPWSVGSQGRANVSHGCTGMSNANAKWMFDHSKMGDVVVYTGSKRALEWGNGYTAWDMSYSRWSAGA